MGVHANSIFGAAVDRHAIPDEGIVAQENPLKSVIDYPNVFKNTAIGDCTVDTIPIEIAHGSVADGDVMAIVIDEDAGLRTDLEIAVHGEAVEVQRYVSCVDLNAVLSGQRKNILGEVERT